MERSKNFNILVIWNNLESLLQEICREYGMKKEDILDFSDLRFSDVSTSILFKLSALLKKKPSDLFNEVKKRIQARLREKGFEKAIEEISFLEPGFINFFISKDILLDNIISKSKTIPPLSLGTDKKIIIEFVSANPTGPLTVAHGRGACVGDCLYRILKFCNFQVKSQYYLNDEGLQIDLLGQSLKARIKELLGEEFILPPQGYRGEYLRQLASEFLQEFNKEKLSDEEFLSQYAVKKLTSLIKEELNTFRVHFDEWVSQKKLREDGKIEEVFNILKSKGFMYFKDGAWWIKSTEFGDSKDRVVIKSDASFTYLAPDIAYHRDKYKDNPFMLINLWGPDHHGYIDRLKASIKALGLNESILKIIIVQHVSLIKDGKKIDMSTRKGTFYTLRELIQEVGVDVARFFYLLRKVSTPLEFNIDLAKLQSKENPVYYIQYAYARIQSIFEKIENFSQEDIINRRDFTEEEMNLIRFLFRFEEILNMCVKLLDPYFLADYLLNLAGIFHRFYERNPVLKAPSKIKERRILICKATSNVLNCGLSLLGISSPQRM